MIWDRELIVIAGDSREEVLDRTADVAKPASGDPQGAPGALRLAIVCESADDRRRKLEYAQQRLADPACRRIREISGVYYTDDPLAAEGKLALLFPGEGAQYPGMLADLCPHFPELTRWFDMIDRAAADSGRTPLPSEVIFGGAEADALWGMDVGTEAVFAANQGLHAVLTRLGVRPDAVVGHSTGEYSALLAAGALHGDADAIPAHIGDLNRLYEREREGRRIGSAALITVGGVPPDRVRAAVDRSEGRVHVALDNCPNQVVLCGPAADVATTGALLREGGGVVEELPFDRPYHTPLFSEFAEVLRGFFGGLDVRAPVVELWSAAAADRFPSDPEAIRELAASQYERPVRFRETVERMYDEGVRLFVEAGPRGNLTTFVSDTLRGRPHAAIPANLAQRPGLHQLHHLLAELAANGVELSLERLHDRLGARPAGPERESRAPARPSRATRLTLGLPLLSASAVDPTSATATPPPAGPAPAVAASDGRAEAVERHLATMARFLETQEAVMTAFLGEPGAVPAPVAPPVAETNGHGPPPAAIAPESAPPPEPPAGGAPDADAVRSAMVEILSDRTGYPPEMLDPSLELESALGIDSIKRIEMLGALAQRLGVPSSDQVDEASRLKTLDEIADFLGGGATPVPPAGPSPPVARALPLAGEAIRMLPGELLVWRKRLSPAEQPFLRDHTLGRGVSDHDPGLSGLPVMPLAMTIELAAEAALALAPDRVVVRIEDVRARRRLSFERGALDVEVTAELEPADSEDERAFRVEIREQDHDEAALTARIVCAQSYPQPPAARAGPLPEAQPSTWTAERIYREALFNGPAFRAVAAVDSTAPAGAVGTLRTLPSDGLVAGQTDPEFAIDPVLLDAAGQVVGVWAADRLDSGFVVFPVAVERLELFAPPPPAGTVVRCRAEVQPRGSDDLVSDIELTDGEGRLLARIAAWEDRRFDVSRRFADFVLSPRDHRLSREWQAPLADVPKGGRFSCRRASPGEAGLPDAGAPFWELVVAWLVLAPSERTTWLERQDDNPLRRREWLLARVAAKDAVRDWAARTSNLSPLPADIELRAEPSGRPFVSGPWLSSGARAPSLSLTHSDGVAVALCGGDLGRGGVGVDIQGLSSRDPGAVAAAAFGGDEVDGVATLREPGAVRDEWALRLWSAKEAVGKALGTGLRDGPRSLRVRDADPASGRARLAAAEGNGDGFVAHTLVEGDFAVAVSILEES